MTQKQALFQPIEKTDHKLLIGVDGVTGQGIVKGGILLAYGLADQQWDRVFVINTDTSPPQRPGLGTFMGTKMPAPHTPDLLINYLEDAARAGAGAIVIDNFSLFWSGYGGTYQQYNAMGAGFGDWAKVDPPWFKMIKWLTNPPCHIVCIMRSKVEYTVHGQEGSTILQVTATAPDMRPNMMPNFDIWYRVLGKGMATVMQGSGYAEAGEQARFDDITGNNLRIMAMGDPGGLRSFGDRSFVDPFDGELAGVFDVYVALTGHPPYNTVMLRAWQRVNKKEIEQYHSEQTQEATDTNAPSDQGNGADHDAPTGK